MPKNIKGGKSHKRGKKAGTAQVSTALKYKDVDEKQEYAKVISLLGDCRMMVQIVGAEPSSCNKTEPVMCRIPGSFRKRIFINKGDYVLVSMRDFQENKVDALCKYTSSEAKTLMKVGEIPFDDISAGDNGEEVDWVTEEGTSADANSTVKKDDNWFNSLLPEIHDDGSDSDIQDSKPLNSKEKQSHQPHQPHQPHQLHQPQQHQQMKSQKGKSLNVSFLSNEESDSNEDEKPEIDLATL